MNNRIPYFELPKKTLKMPGVKKGPPDQKLVLLWLKERLEALLHDERYEEAGKLATDVRKVKEELQKKTALQEAMR